MPLTPEQVAKWKTLVERDTAERESDEEVDESDLEEELLSSTERDFNAMAREAVPTLLSEREEMQREIEALRALNKLQVRAVPVDADPAWRAAALSLLREVEWQPVRTGGGHGDPGGTERLCPFCGRRPPGGAQAKVGGEWVDAPECGHSPNCRLAALLRTP